MINPNLKVAASPLARASIAVFQDHQQGTVNIAEAAASLSGSRSMASELEIPTTAPLRSSSV
jgi:hypothetical protein